MRILKKFLIFAAELVFLFVGFILSVSFAASLDYLDSRLDIIGFLLGFSIVGAVLVWSRRKTEKWTIAADASHWLAYRSWRRLHPRRAKYLRILQRSLLCFPSLCGAFVLFFLPVASHILYSGVPLVPHYHVSTPLNWLIIKSPGNNLTRTFFSNQSAARYGFTPFWFNEVMPSGATFSTSDPASSDGWSRPQSEIASGHTTHDAVREFQLGPVTVTCYEYRLTNNNNGGFSPSISSLAVLWESLCSTQSNGVDYNLRAAFLGHREDLSAFYRVLNSATPGN